MWSWLRQPLSDSEIRRAVTWLPRGVAHRSRLDALLAGLGRALCELGVLQNLARADRRTCLSCKSAPCVWQAPSGVATTLHSRFCSYHSRFCQPHRRFKAPEAMDPEGIRLELRASQAQRAGVRRPPAEAARVRRLARPGRPVSRRGGQKAKGHRRS